MNVFTRKKGVMVQSMDDLSAVAGHVSVPLEDKLVLVWGGYYLKHNNETYRNPMCIYAYHTDLQKWFQFQTKGDIPTENSGCCAVIHGLTLYVFGGYLASAGSSNSLYALDLRTMLWRKIVSQSTQLPTSRNKFAGWYHDRKLWFFGGFGPAPDFDRRSSFLLQNGKFVSDMSIRYDSSWNNQLLCFDLEAETWSNPETFGDIPVPRAAHSAVLVPTENKVYVFGGRHQNERLNDLHVLNMEDMHWTKIIVSPDCTIPCARSWHCMASLNKEELILFGGFTQTEEPLGDVWVLERRRMWWRHMPEYEVGQKRLWHTGVVVGGSLYVHGGCQNNILAMDSGKIYCGDMLVIRKQPSSLSQLCINILATKKPYKKHMNNPIYRKVLLPENIQKRLRLRMEKTFDRMAIEGMLANSI